MKLTKKQFAKIERLMPITRKPAEISSYQFLCALLCMIENGCKWRALPETYGNWHTIYVRMNRWSKNGVLSRVFAALQTEGIIQTNVEVVCLDSTTVKVHPDGTGALKKEDNRRSEDRAEDSPRRFIWLPHLTDRLSAFRSPEAQNTTRRKE